MTEERDDFRDDADRARYFKDEKRKLIAEIFTYPLKEVNTVMLSIGYKNFNDANIFGLAIVAGRLKKLEKQKANAGDFFAS